MNDINIPKRKTHRDNSLADPRLANRLDIEAKMRELQALSKRKGESASITIPTDEWLDREIARLKKLPDRVKR